MKISKELKGAEFEILSYGLNYNKNDVPQVWFKLDIVGEFVDPVYMNLSLDDKYFKWTLANLHYMTGHTIETIFELDREAPNFKDHTGKKFIANIVKNGDFYNVQLPQTSKKLDKKMMKEIDLKHQKTMLEYAGEHASTTEIEIPF